MPNVPSQPQEPEVKEPVKETTKLNEGAAEAGITQPAGGTGVGTLIHQLDDKVLTAELEDLDTKEFIKKHTDNEDANVNAMARVLRLTETEVRTIQRELGYPLPESV